MSLNPSILFVEDSVEVQVVVRAALQSKYQVKVVSTAKAAMEELKHKTFSLILLDVELPDGDGYRICAQIKQDEKHKKTIVVFLSGKIETSHKVMGLSLGADDYISKPFDPLELVARIDARMRGLQESKLAQENVRVGSFRLFPSMHKISVLNDAEEIPLELTTTEYKLLFHLLQHEEQVFSRQQLLEAVWGGALNVTDRTVDTHIYMIRQKLGTLASCIQSVPRVGYKYSQSKTVLAA